MTLSTLPVPELLLETLRRNGRVNDTLLAAIRPEEYALHDGEGGWTVARHLSHLAAFRAGWLLEISPEHATGLMGPFGGANPWAWESRDPAVLGTVFREGDAAAVEAVRAALKEGRTFPDPHGEGTYQSHPAHFLQHVVVHDSHHRGQVLSLLRRGGRTPQEMDALDEHWAIWRA